MWKPSWPLSGQKSRYRWSGEPPRQGGQGTIWKVLGENGRAYALKTPNDPSDCQWLHRERDAYHRIHARVRPRLADLRRLGLDPRLAPAGDWLLWVEDQESSKVPFVVFPWFEQSLKDWLSGRRSLAERLYALERACVAVEQFHAQRPESGEFLIHRDIKPQNFLVRAEGQHVVLADLGGVKEGKILRDVAMTGVFTQTWSPLEQTLCLALVPTPALDLHALGVTVYYGLVGCVPTAITTRPNALNEEGQQLLNCIAVLSGSGQLSPSEARRYEQLRSRRLEELLLPEEVPDLYPVDIERLRSRLEEEAGEEAEAILSLLLPVLEDALRLRPRLRASQAGPLVAALREARRRLGAEIEVLPPPVPERPSPKKTSPLPALLLVASVAVAGLAVVGLGLGGLLWTVDDPTKKAPTSGVEAEAAPPAAPTVEVAVTKSAPPAPGETSTGGGATTAERSTGTSATPVSTKSGTTHATKGSTAPSGAEVDTNNVGPAAVPVVAQDPPTPEGAADPPMPEVPIPAPKAVAIILTGANSVPRRTLLDDLSPTSGHKYTVLADGHSHRYEIDVEFEKCAGYFTLKMAEGGQAELSLN
ncbi:MAG TPA: phosphotransferase, partial [Myxococcota bacterium]|nr:phosphotransferase [Myxococcota bacterium]